MINITVTIAGRPYPLKIQTGDEQEIRRIVKEVNDKINRFQMQYMKKDKQDCLSMALLTYAVDLQKIKKNKSTIPDSDLSDKVNRLENLLDNALE